MLHADETPVAMLKQGHGKTHRAYLRSYSTTQFNPMLEQPRCICMGGHLTEPYEQNTQQSPAFGRNTVLQLSHS